MIYYLFIMHMRWLRVLALLPFLPSATSIRTRVVRSAIFLTPLPMLNWHIHETVLFEDTTHAFGVDFLPSVPIHLGRIAQLLAGRPLPGQIRYISHTNLTFESSDAEWARVISTTPVTQPVVPSIPSVADWDLTYRLYGHNCIDFSRHVRSRTERG